MSATSSSPAEWWSHLEPAPEALFHNGGDPEDPRLGTVARRWTGGVPELWPGRPALIGFPYDEGVRRNAGRTGAALAPDAIRRQLYRLTTWDAPCTDKPAGIDLAPLDAIDLGNLRGGMDLETAQALLGEMVGAILESRAVPIVLGGGHETAFGHYLGYAAARRTCAIVNIDAHLDVRPYPDGGHSGSPFRQAMEYSTHPLPRGGYVVLGAQPHAVAHAHWRYVMENGGRVHWCDPGARAQPNWEQILIDELHLQASHRRSILLTVDADAFRQADVPGVSAPNPVGLDGRLWPSLARLAGAHASVTSIELVECNPAFDQDERTARWAAAGLRQFLVGLALRSTQNVKPPPSR